MCTIKATVVAVYPANPMEFIVRKTFFILLSLCLLAAINGSPAHAQLFITTDTTINWNVGDGEYVFVGVDKWPPDQTINTSPNVSIVSGANIYALASFNSSRINISGGTIGPLLAKNSSTINVSGGNLDRLYANDSCTINMSGGEAVAYWAAQNSTLNFYGHNLVLLNPTPLQGGGVAYTLSGFLADGTDVTGKDVVILEQAKINLIAIGLNVEISATSTSVPPRIPFREAYAFRKPYAHENTPDKQPNTLPKGRVVRELPEGAAGRTTLTIKVTQDGVPISGYALRLSVEADATSGGHTGPHISGRPTGRLSKSPNETPETTLSVTTVSNGTAQVTYTAGEISGKENIIAKDNAGVQLSSISITIQVDQSDFKQFTPGDLMKIKDGTDDKSHAREWRYYGKSTTIDALDRIEAHWRRVIQPTWNQDRVSTAVVLTDISLEWGGLHDIPLLDPDRQPLPSDWTTPHARHRDGIEVDISKSLTLDKLTPEGINALRDIIVAQGGYINEEPHWHITFPGGIDDPNPDGFRSADLNMNGIANADDLNIIKVCMGSHLGDPHYSPVADVNKDDRVDGQDYTLCLPRIAHPDFNKDNSTDLLWQNTRTGGISCWFMSGLSRIGYATLVQQQPMELKIMGTPDLNGDGGMDFLFQNTRTGDVTYWLMNGGSKIAEGLIERAVPNVWQVVGTPDLNSDSKPDLLWQNQQTGQVSYWMLDGTRRTSNGLLTSVPAEWKIVAAVDMDKDGYSDILWQNYQTGDVAYWRMRNLTRLSYGTLALGVPTAWRVMGARNLNSVGKVDILWQNRSTGDIAYWRMNQFRRESYGTLWFGIPLEWQLAGLR